MKTNWNCSNCKMSSTRHWNVKRHIQRRHRGMGEPISYDTMHYHKDMNPENFRFPFAYFHHTSLSFLTQKEKSNKNFSDFLERLLQLLRKIVEYKNLLSQLSTMPQQTGIMPYSGGVYPSMPSMSFDRGESNNTSSEHSKFEDDVDDYAEVVGFKSHVCEKCLITSIDTIFRTNDRGYGQVETKHTCNSKSLADAQLEPNKDKTINDLYEKLPIVMKKKVNSWTEDSAYLVAIEMPPNVDLKNSVEITPNNENHWAARAVKDKKTILNDEELSDFLCKVRNATYASFKVILPSSQEEQQQESSTCHYLMIITANKINLSFELLLQYIADILR